MNTHNLICDFGKHKGELYTRLPVSYLFWMVNSNHSKKDIAQAELDRRGSVLPDMDISGHATDRASLYCWDIYRKTRKKNQGIHAWLIKNGHEALKLSPNQKGRREYNGMLFCFDTSGIWPILKTIIRKKEQQS